MGGMMPGMGGGNNPMQMIQKFMELDAPVWSDNSATVRPSPADGTTVSADAWRHEKIVHKSMRMIL